MSDKKTTGVGFLGWLQLLFIGLKLTNYITWSWWLVMLPFLSIAAILSFLFTIGLIAATIEERTK